MNRPLISAMIVTMLISLSACAKQPSPDAKVLARVSNKFLTLGEFKERVSKLPSYYRDFASRNKKKFLDETLIEMMFYEEAIRRGLDSDREVKDVLREARKKILIAKLIKTEVDDKLRIDEAEVRQYYEAHKDEFKTPELWRASHILVKSEEEAKAVLDELGKGADFTTLARDRSTDATATRGGDVGYFRQGQVVSEFESACASLAPGQTSGIVRSQFGYHIIRLTDKKEPASESYDKAKPKIEEMLKKKKRGDLFDKMVLDLKNKYNVQIEDDVFKSLETIDKEKPAEAK